MIDIDPNDQLDAAVSGLQIAIENVKQQRAKEAKIWQKRALDLQNQVTSLQSQLSEAVNINVQLQSDMNDLTNECEKLRKLNASLSKQLKEKELEISKYNQLNQSLRTLLDGNTTPTQFQPPQISNSPPSFDEPIHTSPKTIHSPHTSKIPKPTTQKRSSGKSGQLLQKAKEQLTYSDFNFLIQEIQRHNNNPNSTNAETLKKIKHILGPQHTNLYDEFAAIMSEK
ncbi:hypothetical protein TVAG_281350 [Trichomonas vaginalis G3]|uniref:At4g15545-like C-terminal domain-containing protein n=1 Tax=Trichomonas vaginalis (strain ATCC PRA-98 / G3) TaxID=412133 RepID=A2F959_TRIV3|nr:hypothetical protein TVAGG3_0236520 [Trichomonas vaginalis G3]EAX98537.1 hypothetical protein TVAG_281350 [Trichomonas vaginalis G3]KAI5553034.1 hypothetical protein TVAGG3_0236520 [Trichomonas vaginalis G3]|eukprot:XP_001311467.1 hypothetical protein [Trichomonas vaginalis G3]